MMIPILQVIGTFNANSGYKFISISLCPNIDCSKSQKVPTNDIVRFLSQEECSNFVDEHNT